jgi:hypothetical protein
MGDSHAQVEVGLAPAVAPSIAGRGEADPHEARLGLRGRLAGSSGMLSRRQPARSGTPISCGSSSISGSKSSHQPPGPPRPRLKGPASSPASCSWAWL